MRKLLTYKKDFILIFSILLVIFLAHVIGYPIPCIFHEITGLLCPGCGITGMVLKIMRFDFIGAFHNNMYVFSLLVFVFVYIIYYCICFILKKKALKIHKHVYTAMLIGALLFAVYRNIF